MCLSGGMVRSSSSSVSSLYGMEVLGLYLDCLQGSSD
jgi:hypothetical protein